MNISEPSLFIEINNFDLISYVGRNDEKNNFEILYSLKTSLSGMEKNRISDFEKFFDLIKENIYHIEKKSNFTFKEIVLILENSELTFINLTGFKNLNGSQVMRENVTYILNSLKACVDETEPKKTILHIFNSKFNLDNKTIENLPIGLFGDFYAHELSFTLINKNDHKNLKTIFDKCNLKIKKILAKSFVKGANISDNNKNTESFFQIKINNNNSKIFFFENNALKFEQDFKFGIDIVIQDISKVTSLKINDVKEILNKEEFHEILNNEIVEREFFKESNFIKIKKKLIFDIALARIKEIFELIIFNNVNFDQFNKISDVIFLEMNDKLRFKGLDKLLRTIFSKNGRYKLNLTESVSSESMLKTANKLVHFGWKKEAIPITQSKKSLIERFFDAIFG